MWVALEPDVVVLLVSRRLTYIAQVLTSIGEQVTSVQLCSSERIAHVRAVVDARAAAPVSMRNPMVLVCVVFHFLTALASLRIDGGEQ